MGSDRPWQSYHTVFTNAKAGMDGVDKEKVQKVVYEMSKGSKYFENEQRKEAMVMQRVQHMQAQATRLTETDLANHEKIADIKLTTLEAERNLSRIWMHVDLDAFYAAVETLEDPSLVGKRMAVGGMSMICTANYEARKFGVRAAMPGFIARKLCPDLIFVRPNFDKYTLYSEQVRQVFRDYDPHFLARSLDEAYLDITEQCTLRNMISEDVAEELRRHVYEKTGLTCSAGVGPNRMVAKVCSDINKPNGQFVVPNERAAVMAFVSTLPIRKVSGIGKVTERLLKEVLDINVCEDLLKKRAIITALFSSISSEFFLSVGLGVGGSDTPLEEPRKSLSCERTFSAISSEDNLFAKLEELADNLSKDMATEELQGRTLTLKIKTFKFEVRTRSLSLPLFIHKKEDLMLHASKLLKAELPVSLRLMGLRISHFQGESMDPSQRTLTDFLRTDGGQPCNISDTGKCSPVCDRDDEGLQKTNRAQGPQIEFCCREVLPERAEIGGSPSLVCLSSKNMLVPPLDPPLSPLAECNGTFSTACERDLVTNPLEKFKNKARDVSSLYERGGDFGFQTDDYDTALECRLLSAMKWVDDIHCSLCKLEIPASFTSERQEHMDFHLAQMLQQVYSSGGGGVEELSRSSKEENKRLQSPSRKEMPPKKGRVGRAESSKEKGRHLPIDAFFSKA